MDIEQLLDELTLDEKAAMVAGVDLWHTAAVERLGIPALKVSDGPAGARGERWTGGHSAAFPCATALGATWDPDIIRAVGERIGVETKRRKAHVLLAPTVNTHRHPLAGRNFECYSEDPYLSSRAAVAYITGVQSQGVGCSVKHFVANDSEFERMTISSEVDERTLREISLVAFDAAVNEAGAWSVMSAYNKLNGTYCSEHPWLLTELLKNEWGFDGFVISDWYGTHSTVPAANAGLDVEMPGPPQHFGAKLAAAVRDGDVDEKVLDDKVRRVLGILQRAGALGGSVERQPEEYVDDPQDRAVARAAAVASFVLLKNDDALLPLEGVRTLAVIGPNVDVAQIMGGGSARLPSHPPVSPLEGLRARFADLDVVHERGCSIDLRTPVLDLRFVEGALHVAYFAGRERAGDPVLAEDGDRGYFTWLGPPAPQVPEDFSVEITATFVPPEGGEWTFSLCQAGRSRLFLDGELLVDNWNPAGRSDMFFGFGSEEKFATITLDAGRSYALKCEAIPAAPALGGLQIGCIQPTPVDIRERAVAAAQRADAVLCIVGTDGEVETEGRDRDNMDLPAPQDDLVRAIVAANPRTAVIVNAASPVSMPWADDVPTIMQCWFPGEEWGNALADVVSGDVTPSGKLPTTLPVRLPDTPAYKAYPGRDGVVRYEEGVFVGYRWYDVQSIEPRYCFGHGLSYTTFSIGELAWNEPELTVSVTNTGPRSGAEVVQCYVHDVEASVDRPPQELRAYAKVALEPGETKTVKLTLGPRAFAFWDTETSDWRVEAGDFELRVGSSSRDISQTLRVTVAGS
jgi:beta-glucosidase